MNFRIWVHEWHLSIRCLTAPHRALRSTTSLYHQRPLPFPILHYVSLREPGTTSFKFKLQPEINNNTARHAAAHGNIFLSDGVGYVAFNSYIVVVVTEVMRIDKVQYSYTYPLLLLTSGPSALQMGSRRRWSRFNAQLDLLQSRRCSPFHWKTIS